LGVKSPALEPRVVAFARDPLQVFLGEFQIVEQHTLKLAAPVQALRHLGDLFEGQRQIALEDLLAKRLWPRK